MINIETSRVSALRCFSELWNSQGQKLYLVDGVGFSLFSKHFGSISLALIVVYLFQIEIEGGEFRIFKGCQVSVVIKSISISHRTFLWKRIIRSITSRVEGIGEVYQQPFCASLSSAQANAKVLSKKLGRRIRVKCIKRQITHYCF